MAAERETVDRLIAAYLAERVNGDLRRAYLGRDQGGTICPIAAVSARMVSYRCHRSATIIIISTKRARALFGERTGKGFQLADARRGPPGRSGAAGGRACASKC